jgi:hypothetical protein
LHFRRPYPDWLYDWLVISYGLLLIGQIRAWWIPYLFRPEPERAARSNHVRQNVFLLAAAQWNGPKYCAYPATFGDHRHVDRSSHELNTASVQDRSSRFAASLFQNQFTLLDVNANGRF